MRVNYVRSMEEGIQCRSLGLVSAEFLRSSIGSQEASCSGVSYPFDQVFQATATCATVKELFGFVLGFVIYCDWGWWSWWLWSVRNAEDPRMGEARIRGRPGEL